MPAGLGETLLIAALALFTPALAAAFLRLATAVGLVACRLVVLALLILLGLFLARLLGIPWPAILVFRFARCFGRLGCLDDRGKRY